MQKSGWFELDSQEGLHRHYESKERMEEKPFKEAELGVFANLQAFSEHNSRPIDSNV